MVKEINSAISNGKVTSLGPTMDWENPEIIEDDEDDFRTKNDEQSNQASVDPNLESLIELLPTLSPDVLEQIRHFAKSLPFDIEALKDSFDFTINSFWDIKHINDLQTVKHCKLIWLGIFESDSDGVLATMKLPSSIEVEEFQGKLSNFIFQFSEDFDVNQQQNWLSQVLIGLRISSRHLSSQEKVSQSSNQEETTQEVNKQSHQQNFLLDLFYRLEKLTAKFDHSIKKISKFLIGYEYSIALSYFDAYQRAIMKLDEIEINLEESEAWVKFDIVHPVKHHPYHFLTMLKNLNKSLYGQKIDKKVVEKNRNYAIENTTKGKNISFDTLPLALLHHASLVTILNSNESFSTGESESEVWEKFKDVHPGFLEKRIDDYLKRSKESIHDWSIELNLAFKDILEEKQENRMEAFIKKNPIFDLSANNSISKSKIKKIAKSPFSSQLNKWVEFIDRISINQLRVTFGDAHHFLRFGPYRREGGMFTWISSEHSTTSDSKNQAYNFNQYLFQSFRISKTRKSTKMDRINVVSLILEGISNRLTKHIPISPLAMTLVENSKLTRIQKPILVLPSLENKSKDRPEYPLALHVCVALERVLELHQSLNSVRAMLELSLIQATHRACLNSILHRIEQQLSLEFLHLVIISRSREFEYSKSDAKRKIDEMVLNINNSNKSIEIEQLKEEYHEKILDFNPTAEGFIANALKDKRMFSILESLKNTTWWKYDLETFDELELTDTIVSWIQHQANSSPIPKVHQRIRGAQKT